MMLVTKSHDRSEVCVKGGAHPFYPTCHRQSQALASYALVRYCGRDCNIGREESGERYTGSLAS